MDLFHGSIAFAVAFIAGMINSLAGGGTLLTFPTLIWLGLNSVTANATSTVALWPFTLGGTFGYRHELKTVPRRIWYLFAPGLLGGLAGAVILKLTPSTTFDKVVPFLILFATVLLMMQNFIQKIVKSEGGASHESAQWLAGAMVFQFGVGIYGGYFGAGIGILMLAALSILGLTDIHQMNGIKNIFGGGINAVAAIYFIVQRMVYWPDVGLMAVASIFGGYVGAKMAKRIGRPTVRKIAILVGWGMAISLFFKK